ncbi:uncharacterized protein LOC108669774 [Hyalella azteca]|uniref:Uncharacterized protein LOC108669774 n=1 Tax=Hyalella azteca TaxID=294128 RepID=A0A8B7NGC0_HYAAZ|nr:uncharacterized protein LOC108669774 [Hyalella azteca]
MMKKFRIKNILTGLFTSVLCSGLAMASYPDSVNVASRSSGLQGCRATTTSVRFKTLTMRGPKSMVIYRRLSITTSNLAFATTASKIIAASDVAQCARMSALADMTAFVFNGTCTAYQFNKKLCSCHGGEKVIYVADSSISYGPPATVTLSTAPYINTTVENVEFKQYQLVNFFSDVLSRVVTSIDGKVVKKYQSNYVFSREDGGYNAISFSDLDLASCVTDTSCGGMPILVNTTHLTYYILNECGKTIQLPPRSSVVEYIAVFSHPGFGCKAFPDGPNYNCSVTFKAANRLSLIYSGYFSGADGSCDGYTLSLERSSYGISDNVNLCSRGWDGSSDSVTFILRGTAAAKKFKVGFSVFVT